MNSFEQTHNPEAIEPAALTPADLRVMYAELGDILEVSSEEAARDAISEFLVTRGLAPLAEGEEQRMVTLQINGEAVEQTIVVGSGDFGTFVRTPEEMKISAEAEQSEKGADRAETEPLTLIEQQLNELAVKNTVEVPEAEAATDVEAVFAELDSQILAPKADTKPEANQAKELDKLERLYDNYALLVNELEQMAAMTLQSREPNEVRYRIGKVKDLAGTLSYGFPSGITDPSDRTNLTMINTSINDVFRELAKIEDAIEGYGIGSPAAAQIIERAKSDLIWPMEQLSKRLKEK